MISTLFLAVLVWVGIPFALVFSRAQWKERAFVLFPIALVTYLGTFALADAILFEAFEYGWSKLAIDSLIASAATFAVLNAIGSRVVLAPRKFHTPKVLAILGGAAALAMLDGLYILAAQTWGFENGTPYFRPPFHSQFQEWGAVLASVLRKDQSPFMIGADTIRVLWIHLAAPVLSVSAESMLFGSVKAVIWLTGVVSFFFIFWTAFLFRPSFLFRPILAVAFFAIVSFHADIFHLASSWISQQRFGIEADGSFAPGFLRYFSLKLIALTSPQSAFFSVFLLGFFVVRNKLRLKEEQVKIVAQTVLASLAILCSPKIGSLFFAIYFGWGLIHKLLFQLPIAKTFAELGLVVVAAFGASFLLFGYVPLDLMNRAGMAPAVFTLFQPLTVDQWLTVPLAPIATMGIAGLAVLGLGVLRAQRKQVEVFWDPIFLSSVGVLLILCYVMTSAELRRLSALVLAPLAVLLLVRMAPSLKIFMKNVTWRNSLASALALSAVVHGYFIYSYTAKPSVVSERIPWVAYLEANEVVREKLKGQPVLAARAFGGIGLDVPFVAQVTTSFGSVSQAIRYNQDAERFLPDLMHMNQMGNPLSSAGRLGYPFVMWGPIENVVWGKKLKERFTDPKNLVATSGPIEIYRVEDRIAKSHQKLLGKKDYYRVLGLDLEKKGWVKEATVAYRSFLAIKPEQESIRLRLAKLLMEGPLAREALYHFSLIQKKKPKDPEIHNFIGMTYMRLRQVPKAIQLFEYAIKLDPKYVIAYNNLGAVALMGRDFKKAKDYLTRGAKVAPRDAQIQINLGRYYLSQFDLTQANRHFDLAKRYGKNESVVLREANMGLGETALQEGRPQKAYDYFGEVIRRDPGNVGAHLRSGKILADQGDKDKAKGHFIEVLKRDPRNRDAQMALQMLATS